MKGRWQIRPDEGNNVRKMGDEVILTQGQCVSTNGHQRETVYSVHDKGKGLSKPKRKYRTRVKHTEKCIKHSTKCRGRLPEEGNEGEQLPNGMVWLGEVT
jgi:hypothetical protein